MQKMNTKYILIAIVAITIASCKTNIKPEAPTAGDAKFDTYVAIGGSYTSGYTNGSLYQEAQINSYPNMLAAQFALVGGQNFRQPLLPGEVGWPNKRLVLGTTDDCRGFSFFRPYEDHKAWDSIGSAANIGQQGWFGNAGIPDIRVSQMIQQGVGTINPYARRVMQNPSIQTPLEMFLAKVPDFFSVWLGSSDVMAYAIAGGEGNASGLGANDITPVAHFKQMYDTLINNLMKHDNAKGILINIPDIANTPFVSHINIKGLNLSHEQANLLNNAYQLLGNTNVNFKAGSNAYVIKDKNNNVRHIKDGEFVLLSIPQDSLICGEWGRAIPIPSKYVLEEDEVASIREATYQFNVIIAEAADTHNLPVVDANALFKSFAFGVTYGGANYNADYIEGGIFSLDAIYLTGRGYALVANEIIKEINRHYKSTIPYVDVNKYVGIRYP